MKVIVLGCGVSGLSCAIRLREAGYEVQIWARDLPPHTTSNVAAALWYPYKAYPEELVGRWAATTYVEFVQLAEVAGTGVMLREGLEIFPGQVDDPWWRDALPGFRRASAAELPPGYQDGYAFKAPVIEMPVYLNYLRNRFEALGGSVQARHVRVVDEAFAQAEVVVNCCGLGARELVDDNTLYAIRGQVVWVEQVGIERFLLDDHGPRGLAYIVPRAGDCVLGGTAEDAREDLEPDPAVARAIIERCSAHEPRLRETSILAHHVGLRPGRPTVRLEAERRASDQLLIHNYGHGGAGVTLSWGCAQDVVNLQKRRQKAPRL